VTATGASALLMPEVQPYLALPLSLSRTARVTHLHRSSAPVCTFALPLVL